MFIKGRMFYYAPDGAEGGSPEASTGSSEAAAPASDNSYDGQFGTEVGEVEKPLDLDKIKPLYDELNLDGEAETIEQPEEVKPEVKDEKPVEPPKPEVNMDELAKAKAELEEYKKGEEARFNQYYEGLKRQESERAALGNQVESLFADENFVKQLENAETGNDVAKIIMSKSIEMADKLLQQKLAPVFNLVQSYQQEQVDKRTNEVFNNFRSKYGQEADRALTPGTPEHKALVAELQANPSLPLEKAFLLVRPNFAQKQIQSEVKKAIDEKRSMALPPSAGRSSATASTKIESPRDAVYAALREMKNKNRQD